MKSSLGSNHFIEPINILLVEDNPGDVRLTKEALKEGNFISLDDLVKELGLKEGDMDKDVQS